MIDPKVVLVIANLTDASEVRKLIGDSCRDLPLVVTELTIDRYSQRGGVSNGSEVETTIDDILTAVTIFRRIISGLLMFQRPIEVNVFTGSVKVSDESQIDDAIRLVREAAGALGVKQPESKIDKPPQPESKPQ